MDLIFKRYLPITSFIISCSALVFQLTVLFPWHHELDAEFKRLKHVKEQKDLKLEEYEKFKLEKI